MAVSSISQVRTLQRIQLLTEAFCFFIYMKPTKCSGMLVMGYTKSVLEGGLDWKDGEREIKKCWRCYQAGIFEKDSNWVDVIMTGLLPIKLSHWIVKSHRVIVGIGGWAECLNTESQVVVLILVVRSDRCPVLCPSSGARFTHSSSTALSFI